jgi:Kdo2-lipid IVA lauroyltransferase/acyltransferase
MFNLLYAFGWIVTLLPLRILYILSDIFYPIIYYVVGYRKAVVRTNLKKSFPDKTEKELRRIERRFYHFFCDLFLETLYEINISENEIKRRFTFINIEGVLKQHADGKGIMIMTAHYGNWEWGMNFPLFTPRGMISCQIYKELSNKQFDRFMCNLRAKFGGINVEKRDLLRTMIKYKSSNDQGIYWMISDQTPAEQKIHYWTELLHQDTPTLTGTEQLARKFDYAVFYAEIKCIKRGYYQCELIPITLEPTQTSEFEITEKYTQLLQKTIETQPEYWLWSHRRWKYSRV